MSRTRDELINEALEVLGGGSTALRSEALEDAEKFSGFSTYAFGKLQDAMSPAFRAYDKAMTQLQALGRRPNDALTKAIERRLENEKIIDVDYRNIEIAMSTLGNLLRTQPSSFEINFTVPVTVEIEGTPGRQYNSTYTFSLSFRKDGTLDRVTIT